MCGLADGRRVRERRRNWLIPTPGYRAWRVSECPRESISYSSIVRSSSDNPLLAGLRGARLFRGLDARLVESLSRAAYALRLREGEHLWRAGQKAEAFTVIQRGLVQIERSVAGKEPAILGIFGPRESVGDAAALACSVYPADALAASAEVQIIRVPGEVLLRAMEEQPALARAVQLALLDHTQMLTAKIDIVSAGSVTARLATLLLHLSERFGDEQEDGVVRVPISLSRVALSRLISARVETVIRALSAMRREGVLRMSTEGVEIVRQEALRKKAADG